MKQHIYSFDIFDTCLTRLYAQPQDLFFDLAHDFLRQFLPYGFDSDTINLFALQRKRSERYVRRFYRNKKEDITLRDIYQNLRGQLPFNFDIEEAMALELSKEKECLRPILSIKEKITHLRAQGQRILFISDMYLPSNFIKECLIEHGIAEENDNVYVSGEIGLTKKSGNLYKKVLEHENSTAQQLVHCGDNFHSDIKMAKALGINTEYFNEAHLSYYEKRAANITDIGNIAARSKIIGASRLTRLNLKAENQEENSLNLLASDIVAPVLTAFVSWVLEDAKQHGIKRLYFVSRDGQIMFKIAQRIVLGKSGMPECRYLYGSRQAWFAPSVDQPSWQHFSWLIQGSTNRLGELLHRLCIHQHEIEEYLKLHKLFTEIDTQVEGNLLEQFKTFVTDPDVFKLLHSRACELRKTVVGYLRQEGIFDEQPWALVDLGWQLNCQAALSRLIKSTGYDEPLLGYYFGVKNNLPDKQSIGDYRPWITQNKKNTPVGDRCHWLYRSNTTAVIEHIFTPADHPSVYSYHLKENRFVPFFRLYNENPKIKSFTSRMHLAVEEFIDLLPDVMSEQQIKLLTDHSIKLTGDFFSNPKHEYLQGITKIKINREQTHAEDHNSQLASKMPLRDIVLLVLYGNRYNRVISGYIWLEGSAELSPFVNRLVLKSILKIRNFINLSKVFLKSRK